jgi:hypothetical protein
MKLLLPALTLITAMTIGTSAQAQNYPWCAQYGTGMGGMNCGFVSFAQCMATVSGIGGFCMQNNTYQQTPGSYPLVRRRYPY